MSDIPFFSFFFFPLLTTILVAIVAPDGTFGDTFARIIIGWCTIGTLVYMSIFATLRVCYSKVSDWNISKSISYIYISSSSQSIPLT